MTLEKHNENKVQMIKLRDKYKRDFKKQQSLHDKLRSTNSSHSAEALGVSLRNQTLEYCNMFAKHGLGDTIVFNTDEGTIEVDTVVSVFCRMFDVSFKRGIPCSGIMYDTISYRSIYESDVISKHSQQ